MLDKLQLGDYFKEFVGVKIGKLNKPSKFYDYTRFRPTVYLDSKSGDRKFKILTRAIIN